MFRLLSTQLSKKTNKVIVLLGARQVGKTTLLKNVFPDGVYINLEKSNYLDIFNSRDLTKIKNLIEQESKIDKNVWILDEVQRLDDPGLIAKVIYDEIPDIHIIISGSSSLEIANKASESLAGRKITFHIYPLSFQEKLVQKNLITHNNISQSLQLNPADNTLYEAEIKECMQFGMYPELLQMVNNQEKEEYLLELVDSIILKDIYYLNLVKNTKNLLSLLKLLAYQIGQQISITDLADRVGITRPTVMKYIEILKKTYIIYTLPPYTKKRRDEIGKTEKIFFYDLGLRNAIINDFSPVEFRRDYGSLFENFVITETLKLNAYNKQRYAMYYWRTKSGSEIDLILVKDDIPIAIEIKTRKMKITPVFKNTYPDATELNLTMKNIATFLL